MTRPIIEVDNVSKRYRLGQFNARTLREEAERLFRRRRSNGKAGGSPGDHESEFWALKEVSFSVQQGEVIGIIGRNGAGKSTLLKILSRVTEPTSGLIRIRGRVASLLEVGTGFHPELTGRENIYLNGAILGMNRAEIKSKFDEIVAFAEVEKFLDTPVKRYSSGMYVRLAFAVAAHLEPDILIVDEVLAVGDAEFQKKCLGKMRAVASGLGRTVVFVSHNLQAVSTLCERVFLLEQGKLANAGPADDVLRSYITGLQPGVEDFRVTTPLLRWRGLQNRRSLDDLRCDQDLMLELGFETGQESISNLHVDIELVDERDRTALHCKSKFVREPMSIPSNTNFAVRYLLHSPHLAPGPYRLTVYAAAGTKELCWVEQIDACRVSAASPFFPDDVLQDVKGTTVPGFSVDLVPSTSSEYVEVS